ncbi:alpha/beta fold hydrolase [Actinoplanes sp. NPDC051343]|jgi:pimeloyl-ACP methyl ester carboxylesterase|uniref:alpha/beta fold hydrolase n=1 Tax=Actinoplanes sp. NPDC051343 TaxID=3363906 RepID=UPI00379E3623
MTLAHDVTGSGPAVLLLHSMVCDRRMWSPQVAALSAAGFRVIRCDLGGFGESPLPAGPYDDAGDVVALLDSLGVPSAAVVASSGSGPVAAEVAARWPSRVPALVLVCSALPGWPPSPARQAFAGQEDALLASGDITAATELNLRTFVGPAAGDAARLLVRDMQRHIFEVQLSADEPEAIEVPWEFASITARTLVVSGDLDLPDFPAIADELARRIPGASRARLQWAGHLPSLEDPSRFDPLLLGFLLDAAR